MGGVWLGLVLWVYLDQTNIATVTNDMEGFTYVLYFLMVVGAIVFILGLLGCCGACQESQCMLATFFALVLVLLMGQVAIGVWVRSNEERFSNIFTESLTNSIKRDYGKDTLKTEAFDKIQSNLDCCGSEGPTDWPDSFFNGAGKEGFIEKGVVADKEYSVPDSCCVAKGCNTVLDISLAPNPDVIYTDGCSRKILNLVKTHSNEILYVLLAIILVQVLAMIVSMVLCCTVRRIDHVKA
ncbi:Tetraspanin-1 [Chionoecetes opilio]|uniref:Tetraspanin n=1 Tax=Chionoecetes opilio TaxID=41210 RepID=A0A8J8WAW8_CHIOP|nr:Tetraspanin-1 [Chionoecetes opilio]